MGAVTTVVFLGLGWTVWTGGRPYTGGLLVVLGIYRLVAWVREVRIAFQDEED